MAGGMRTLNTALTRAFVPDGVRCFLLRRGSPATGETQKFIVIGELTAGYWMDFDLYRNAATLEYATPDLTFRDTWAIATHVAYGVPLDGKFDLFKQADSPQKDGIDPTAASPFWKMFLEKLPTERFTIPSTP